MSEHESLQSSINGKLNAITSLLPLLKNVEKTLQEVWEYPSGSNKINSGYLKHELDQIINCLQYMLSRTTAENIITRVKNKVGGTTDKFQIIVKWIDELISRILECTEMTVKIAQNQSEYTSTDVYRALKYTTNRVHPLNLDTHLMCNTVLEDIECKTKGYQNLLQPLSKI
jgi:hypothetical protein